MCGLLVVRAQPAVPVVDGSRVVASFDAISGDRPITYKDHPDLALAACSNCGRGCQMLVATGQDIAGFDVRGTRLKQPRTREFVAAAGVAAGTVDDPRATFDLFIRRWIVVCSCSNDFLIVSAGDDATGPWRGAALTAAKGDLTMFPGWDRNGVYVSEYQAPLNARYIALPTDPEYLIARSGPPQNATNIPMDLFVDRITWSNGQASVSGPDRVPTGFFYSKPIAVPQPAGPAVRGTESHRVFSVAAFERHLHVVVSSGPCQGACGEQGSDANDVFFWFDIDTATMTLHQKAKAAHPRLGFVFPTLAVDARGNVLMAATGGSGDQPPSIYRRQRQPV